MNNKLKLASFEVINPEESSFFDSLRGGSALLVVIGHLYMVTYMPNFSHPIATKLLYSLAGYSVMVFFALSGFMIAMALYRNASDNLFNSINIPQFVTARLTRLYPPLIAALLLCIFVLLFVTVVGLSPPSGMETSAVKELKFESGIPASLFFLQNIFESGLFQTPKINSPLWSLSHEFWFYVAGFLLALLCVSRGWAPFFAFCLLCSIVVVFGKKYELLL